MKDVCGLEALVLVLLMVQKKKKEASLEGSVITSSEVCMCSSLQQKQGVIDPTWAARPL